MKIICEGIELSDAVMKVVKACSTKTTNPILESIKVSAENDVLTLLATDGEIAIEKKIKAEVLEEGAVCVPGKYFSDFIKKLENAQITLSCESEKLDIKYGDSESSIQVLPAEDFPAIDIQQVGHRLQSVEGDADGQDKVGNRENGRHMENAQKCVPVSQKELAVFEGEKQANVNDHAQENDGALLLLNGGPDGFPLFRFRLSQLLFSSQTGELQPQPQVMNGEGGEEQIYDQRPADRPEEHIACQQQDYPAHPLGRNGVEACRGGEQKH